MFFFSLTSSQNLSLGFQIKRQSRIFVIVEDDETSKLRYFYFLFTGYEDKCCSLFYTATSVSDTVTSALEDVLTPAPPSFVICADNYSFELHVKADLQSIKRVSWDILLAGLGWCPPAISSLRGIGVSCWQAELPDHGLGSDHSEELLLGSSNLQTQSGKERIPILSPDFESPPFCDSKLSNPCQMYPPWSRATTRRKATVWNNLSIMYWLLRCPASTELGMELLQARVL